MEKPLFVFAHGAGAPSSHPWMQRWGGRLATIGAVSMFDYPYMKERRRRPDPLSKLISAHLGALAEARQTHSGPIVASGETQDEVDQRILEAIRHFVTLLRTRGGPCRS